MKSKKSDSNYYKQLVNLNKVFIPISSVSNKINQPTFVIGGYVRDLLLNRKSEDIDIVTLGSGIKLAQEVEKEIKCNKISIFKNFGTAMLKNDAFELQFVGARKESYSKDSRNPIVEDGSLEDDQKRRDFTINALAIGLNDDKKGVLLDPFDGIKDLDNKIIKTPLDPNITFSDDPLRMMRAIRFSAQLNFDIEELTYYGIVKNTERIKIVAQERITEELNKIILSKNPSKGFKLLDKTGLLDLIFPEFSNLKGVEIRNGNGHKDNFYHTLKVLDNLLPLSENNLWLRWAALLHDIAKPITKRYHSKSGWTFHGHEDKGAKMVPSIFKKLKLPLDNKMRYVQKLVLLHLRPISLTNEKITDSALRRLLFEAGNDIDDLIKLCKSDITSKNKEKVNRYKKRFEKVEKKLKEVEEKDRVKNWQPPIDGKEIMETYNLEPCKEIGLIKEAIKNAILDGEIENNYKEAKELMEMTAIKMGIK